MTDEVYTIMAANISRCVILTLGFVLSLLSIAAAEESKIAAERPPNILFFLADDLGWADLGCYGSTFYESPTLDRLAEDGVRFTSAYTAGTVCSPTRASIITGQATARHGCTNWGGDLTHPEKHYTLAIILIANFILAFIWALGICVLMKPV